jgi:predicted nucleic acid-binding protein
VLRRRAHEQADEILRLLTADGGAAVVPVLSRYEVRAVLARAQLRGMFASEEIGIFLEDLAEMNITVDAASADCILTDVHQLALQHRLTSYDAAYLELALQRDLPLATLDVELRRAAICCRPCTASALRVFLQFELGAALTNENSTGSSLKRVPN